MRFVVLTKRAIAGVAAALILLGLGIFAVGATDAEGLAGEGGVEQPARRARQSDAAATRRATRFRFMAVPFL